MARPTAPQGDNKVWALFQEPAYILARPMTRRAKFLREAHPTTLDVLDRHMLLQVAYSTSPCGKWLFVAVVDQTGAAHDLCAHAVPGDAPEPFVVSTVWDFTLGMAVKANVEWHIVIAKWGFMSPCELDGTFLLLGLQNESDACVYSLVSTPRSGDVDMRRPSPTASDLACR